MPYTSKDDLPEQVKNNLTDHEQEIFMAAFNSAYDGTCKDREDKEECCFKIAWAAAKKEKKEEESFTREKPRYFNLSLGEKKFERTDKGLVVRDVIALAEGCWTASNVQTPCYYSAGVLKDKVNFKDNGLWSRHAGGMPRAISEKIGWFEDKGFDEVRKARLVDLILHLKSQASRDIADMIEAGVINAVSAEVGGEEWYNRKLARSEALTADIYGLATVDRGACETCLIRYKEKPHVEAGAEMENADMNEEEKKMFADFDSRLKALEEKIATFGADNELKKEVGEVAKLASEMKEELGKSNERIKALELKPDPKTKIDAEGDRKEFVMASDVKVVGSGITRA